MILNLLQNCVCRLLKLKLGKQYPKAFEACSGVNHAISEEGEEGESPSKVDKPVEIRPNKKNKSKQRPYSTPVEVRIQPSTSSSQEVESDVTTPATDTNSVTDSTSISQETVTDSQASSQETVTETLTIHHDSKETDTESQTVCHDSKEEVTESQTVSHDRKETDTKSQTVSHESHTTSETFDHDEQTEITDQHPTKTVPNKDCKE